MREYSYTVTEHDAERGWIVRERQHETVRLEDEVNFFTWAAARYPQERFTVELDPWSLSTLSWSAGGDEDPIAQLWPSETAIRPNAVRCGLLWLSRVGMSDRAPLPDAPRSLRR